MATVKRNASLAQRFANPQRFASDLFHQQLFCWGKDIESASGNLLVRYGLERTPAPPDSRAASLYRVETSATRRIVLRGFGLFIGDDRWGGIFVRRETFFPMLTRTADLTRPVWLAEDLPRLRRPQADDRGNVQKLLIALTVWIADYERWITAHFGLAYRRRSLVPWKKLRNLVIPASEITASWQLVQRWIERDELHFCK